MIDAFCQWLYDTPWADAIRANELLFPWFESVHVLAITLVLGSIAVVDLRLLGLASRNRPVTRLIREVLPVTWSAFAVAVLTGGTLFASNAVNYAHNGPFQMKMLLMLLAGLNMLVFHFVTYRSVAEWDEAPRTPFAARFAGGFSITIWLAIVAFGRWIGFTIGF
ncbi:MAG TPA: DUF6644 family protein [Steroidobacteraceae bacterium]|jgi:hypothetical protein|nr:DUF6644 family protein [Steroidobacteraceae bacterium]